MRDVGDGISKNFSVQIMVYQEHRSRNIAGASVLLALECGAVDRIVWGLPNVAKFCEIIRLGNMMTQG